ncbi:hypothetical protein MtrunA17_Chr1g0156991 [Medicago truncatula]|uniref:Uncharacterized protein n=1 Tax=Medicago truncatula TaxID=3880 RepID=A0A396JKD0_MEDTR|nr:hypothetical protein MtrunA17_Chr1g0156991 [Medicago truncatula]
MAHLFWDTFLLKMASPSSFQLGLLLSSPFVCFCPVSSLGSTVVSCGSSF